MGKKLHLKRTPAEQAEHDLRKSRRAARHAAKRARHRDDYSDEERASSTSTKRRRVHEEFDAYEESCYPSSSHSNAYKQDYDYVYARMEEERFREKMWGAFEDDERLDSMEAKLNSYTHIPRRWRSGGMDRMDDELDIDPQMMEDEDYAEWIRSNMWKRRHAAEFEEQERKKAERAAREAHARTLRDETRRLETQEEQRRRQRRREKDRKRWTDARAAYESKWKSLLNPPADGDIAGEKQELTFEDVPWPVFVLDVGPLQPIVKGADRAVHANVPVDDLTVEAISAFLIPQESRSDNDPAHSDTVPRERKEKLRETMLRYHPDKFEGRILRYVREADKERAREAAGKVTRAVTELLASKVR